MCDSPLQKIPTAVFEQRIQPSLECTSPRCFQITQEGENTRRRPPLRSLFKCIHPSEDLNYTRSIEEGCYFKPIGKPGLHFPTFFHPDLRPGIIPISSGYGLLLSFFPPHCLSVLMVGQLQQRSHRQAIKQRCLRGMSQHPSCCHRAIFINQLTWERINNISSTLQHHTVIYADLQLGTIKPLIFFLNFHLILNFNLIFNHTLMQCFAFSSFK